MKAENQKQRVCPRFAAILLSIAVLMTCFPGFSAVSFAASASGKVTANGGNLNVRSGPSMNNDVISCLKDGTKVTVKSKAGSWYKIEYVSGKVGYVYKTYLKVSGKVAAESGSSGAGSSSASNQEYPVTAKVTNGGVPLKLRKQATTASSILAEIPRGSSLKITDQYNANWYKASYGGRNGYVYASYIIMPDQVTSSGSSSGNSSTSSSSKPSAPKYQYPRIDLDVPFYSQTDSRWANLKLGKTRYTISQIGCVVCGLAQIQSYQQGKQITPAKMLKTLSFDGNGCVYWPSGSHVNTSSNYSANIYKQLAKGKPVLVGAFTPSGKQHWVVATGYDVNSNRLSSSHIQINDCSGRYKTLKEFLTQYSRFYKIVYLD